MDSRDLVRKTGLIGISAALCLACGQQPAKSAATAAPPSATAPAAPAKVIAPPADSAQPTSFAPLGWQVLGPLPNPAAPDGKGRSAMAIDLLASLGGESAATLAANTKLSLSGQTYTAKSANPDKAGIVDLAALYRGDSDMKVAYAYAEVEAAATGPALVTLGSDDSVALWINGKEVHRTIADRPIKLDQERFLVPLMKGKNRILLKIDNGGGGWAFALSLYDKDAQRKLEAMELRRHLERVEVLPTDGSFLLKGAFPRLVFLHPIGAETVLGEPRIRWFDASLAEVERPERDGRYLALVEAPTRDGQTYRRLVTFAKLPDDILPWVPFEPFGSPPVVELPWGKPLSRAAHQELSRQMWRATQQSFGASEGGAITALALAELDPKRPPAEALAWFETGLYKDLERKLLLRMRVEGRQPKPFEPPSLLDKAAGELKSGNEAEAGMKPGTVKRLRAFFREWEKADEHPFVALLARKGVVFMHEGFNGLGKDALFRSASIAKSISGLTFARAVNQGLLSFDQPLSSVFPGYAGAKTRALTFRHCFYHLSGLQEHFTHGGLLNPFLDNDFLVQDFPFTPAGVRFIYNGDDVNLADVGLSLVTGRTVPSLLHEHLQAPFGEPVLQLDGATSGMFTARYLAKVGQMLLQDGKYGRYQFYSPGFLSQVMPKKVAEYAPSLEDKELEAGIGLSFMPDPDGPREKGVLGANVVGHGSGAGVFWRVAFDRELVVVVGRNDFNGWQANEIWGDRLAALLAENLAR